MFSCAYETENYVKKQCLIHPLSIIYPYISSFHTKVSRKNRISSNTLFAFHLLIELLMNDFCLTCFLFLAVSLACVLLTLKACHLLTCTQIQVYTHRYIYEYTAIVCSPCINLLCYALILLHLFLLSDGGQSKLKISKQTTR